MVQCLTLDLFSVLELRVVSSSPMLGPHTGCKGYLKQNETKRKKGGTRNEDKTTTMQEKNFKMPYTWSTKLSAPENFKGEISLGWENQGGLQGGLESSSECCWLSKETSFVGSTTFLTSASVRDLHSAGVDRWLIG